MGTCEFYAWGNPTMDEHPIMGRVENITISACFRNWDKLWPDEPLGSYAVLLLKWDGSEDMGKTLRKLSTQVNEVKWLVTVKL